jgi:diguanylate cyclase (GGDEF)-like protein/PAS domain S-box-containing protein
MEENFMEAFINNISRQSEIMVIDDAPENIHTLTRILMEHKINVISATSGSVALKMLNTEQPNLILLDVKMPYIGGIEVCKRIKENPMTKDIPIIFISALDSIEDKIKGLEAGASDYITKPFNEKEVVLRVKNSLEMQMRLGEVKKKQRAEIAKSHKELVNQSEEIKIQADELIITNIRLTKQTDAQIKQSVKLKIANIDLIKRKALEQELLVANKELIYQNNEKAKRADELQIANKELVYQNDEKSKRADELLMSERRYAQLSEQSRIFTWEVDIDGLYTFVDNVSEIVTGYKPEELIRKKHFYDLCPECERAKSKTKATTALAQDKQFENYENHIVNKNGSVIVISRNGIPLFNSIGKCIGYRGTDIDITERKNRETEISYLSYHDKLTGLYNRRFFEEELIRLDNLRNLPLTIIMGDVNGLKLVNDSFGHLKGDELLKAAANLLKTECRADDIIARWGGDEFVIILPKSDKVEAKKLVNRINEISSNEKIANINLSISFGYDSKIDINENIVDIIKKAEDHLYKQKLYNGASIKGGIVDLIMKTLYEKNQREMLHSKRVSIICGGIAELMNFSNDEVAKMKLSGLMHDIGKIGIDEKILNKNDILDNEEWYEMKKHSEIGYRILSSVSEFSEIANYVLEHHEKWDGTGYPKGLKGLEISMQARIVAIADSFDAMTGKRAYGKKYSKVEALKELNRNAGTHFDPEIVKIFVGKVANKL